jgi:hypothetical protein
MEWTLGSLMFYSGIAGAALTLTASVIAVIVLRVSRRSITRKLNEEYGGNLR